MTGKAYFKSAVIAGITDTTGEIMDIQKQRVKRPMSSAPSTE